MRVSREDAKNAEKNIHRLLFKSIYDSSNPMLNECRTEIDEQSQAQVKQTKICQQLFLVYRSNHFNGFQFDNYFPFYDNIRSISFINLNILINDWQYFLSLNRQMSLVKLISQHSFID